MLDANASLTADEALALLAALGDVRERIALFEQPTAADDLAGLRARARRPACASPPTRASRTPRTSNVCAAAGAVDVVNLKIMKTGLVAALDAAIAARSARASA